MSHDNENGPLGPSFEEPAGVSPSADDLTEPLGGSGWQSGEWTEAPMRRSPKAEEMTLPVVDLYRPAVPEPGMSSYGDDRGQWNPGYGPVQQPGPAPYPLVRPSQQPGWGPGPYGMPPQEHPQATTILVFGAVSIAVPVLSFVAWYMGNKARAEIGRGAPYPYAGNLKTGHIIGKVMGILTIVGASLYALFLVFYVILIVGLLGM